MVDGEGGTNWKSSMETYTLPYVKLDSQWEFVVWCRELKPGALWQTKGVGWSGRWEGGLRGSGHVYTYGWFMLMYGRNQHNIVKQLSSNWKINKFIKKKKKTNKLLDTESQCPDQEGNMIRMGWNQSRWNFKWTRGWALCKILIDSLKKRSGSQVPQIVEASYSNLLSRIQWSVSTNTWWFKAGSTWVQCQAQSLSPQPSLFPLWPHLLSSIILIQGKKDGDSWGKKAGWEVTWRPFSLAKYVSSSTERSLYEADDQPKGKILPLIYYLSPNPIQCFIVPLSSGDGRWKPQRTFPVSQWEGHS